MVMVMFSLSIFEVTQINFCGIISDFECVLSFPLNHNGDVIFEVP